MTELFSAYEDAMYKQLLSIFMLPVNVFLFIAKEASPFPSPAVDLNKKKKRFSFNTTL